MTIPNAIKKAEKYLGKNVYTFFVRVRLIDGTIYGPQTDLGTHKVVAHTGADACNHVMAQLRDKLQEPHEVETRGVKGGITHRYAGWWSVVANGLGSSPYHDSSKGAIQEEIKRGYPSFLS